MNNGKRAVVLSGGGTKGAYELGVWRALKELSIDYDIVTGTSIGSVNGALMTIGDYEFAKKIWSEMFMGDLMGDPPPKKNPILQFLETFFLPPGKRGNKLVEGSVDNTPFLHFVENNINADRLMDSKVDYGLVTVRARDRKPFLLTKEQMTREKIKDYIIASSSVYPVFPMHAIDGIYFIDGMYHDNLPIGLALSMGATELIVVDLHQTPQHPEYAGKSNVVYLCPSEDLGGILAFDRKKIEENIEMGYQDAIRKFAVGRT